MKQVLALVVIVFSVVILYRTHQDRLKTATAEAAAIARADALRSRATPVPPPPATPAPPAQVLISRKIEQTYIDLMGPVDGSQPYDLVPPIQLMKERLMDSHAKTNGAKQAIYERAIQLATAMEAAAEERTRALESMVNHLTRARSALDQANSTTTGAFFAQSAKSKWDAEVRRRKPPLDQLFASLRAQEREWNKIADGTLAPDDFESANIPPPTITADPTASTTNPLERGTYNDRRAIYPWRRAYYDQVGYRYR
jgi:hypothetical protein